MTVVLISTARRVAIQIVVPGEKGLIIVMVTFLVKDSFIIKLL